MNDEEFTLSRGMSEETRRRIQRSQYPTRKDWELARACPHCLKEPCVCQRLSKDEAQAALYGQNPPPLTREEQEAKAKEEAERQKKEAQVAYWEQYEQRRKEEAARKRIGGKEEPDGSEHHHNG